MPKRIVLSRRQVSAVRLVNRTIAVIKPKQPLLDWLQAGRSLLSPGNSLLLRGTEKVHFRARRRGFNRFLR
jgi:hypothetical protein